MRLTRTILLFCFLWIIIPPVYSQLQKSPKLNFDEKYVASIGLSKVGLYAKSIETIDEAIQLTNENGLEEEAIMARIDRAEIMRKTQGFKRGLNILQNFQNSEKYPLQHVRFLDRSVALIFEGNFYLDKKRMATILSLLDYAIVFAFRAEETLLKNQKGIVSIYGLMPSNC